jgi:hypothetical protein
MTQEIAEIPVPKVLLPVEYALGWRTSRYPSTTFNVGTPIYWDNFETNSPDIEKESTGEFKNILLSGGKVYKLTGYLSGDKSSSTAYDFRIRWWNVTDSKWFGSEGGAVHEVSYGGIGGSPAMAYVSLEKDTVFELRCSFEGVSASLYLDSGTAFNVEHLQNLTL